MKESAHWTTIVIDGGARYGTHPSWTKFKGDLRYYGFEPDADEAARLRKKADPNKVEIISDALSNEMGSKKLIFYKHRGYSSFLDVDPESDWFKTYRPGEAEVEGHAKVKAITIDGFSKTRDIDVDFLKLDTEGTELEALQGADFALTNTILGLRVEVSFQPSYRGQALFPEIHNFLMAKGFFLLNLDYLGKGVPRNFLFRNPDPLQNTYERYGVMVTMDGVWLKKPGLFNQSLKGKEQLDSRILKYAYFCMLNNAPDVGLDILHNYAKANGFELTSKDQPLYLGLRRECAEYLGRWRVFPDEQWRKIQAMFKDIFCLELEGGNQFWEFLQIL